MFLAYYGSQYGCSPKYLSEHIMRIHPEWDVIWAFTQPDIHYVDGVKKIRYLSLRFFYELCTSGFFITNYRMPKTFRKRKGQCYIMTWHSSLRLKMIEKDAEKTLPASYIEMAKADSRKIDVVLSGCRFSDEVFRHSFWYDGIILRSGTPRIDPFYAKDLVYKKSQIQTKLDLSKGTNILLYAPTFRGHGDLTCYNLDYKALKVKLEEMKGGKWKILVRLHPHLKTYSQKLLADSDVLDVTDYDDIQELLLVADLLITDYSSLMFDFAETRRPCFLYVPDLEQYQAKDRSFYFDIEALPFPKSSSQQELEYQMLTLNLQTYIASVDTFMKSIGSYEDGGASQRVVEYIEKWIEEKS